jgi:hypothetical protein
VAKTHEERKADMRAYYQANKETFKQKAKQYYKANKEVRDAQGREWARTNKDKTREYNRKSYEKDPSKTLIRVRARKIKMKGNGVKSYTLEQVLEEYGSVCYLCEVDIDLTLPRKIGVLGWEFGLHLDHVTPISKGGSDCLENVAPTHAICNLTKRGN